MACPRHLPVIQQTVEEQHEEAEQGVGDAEDDLVGEAAVAREQHAVDPRDAGGQQHAEGCPDLHRPHPAVVDARRLELWLAGRQKGSDHHGEDGDDDGEDAAHEAEPRDEVHVRVLTRHEAAGRGHNNVDVPNTTIRDSDNALVHDTYCVRKRNILKMNVM